MQHPLLEPAPETEARDAAGADGQPRPVRRLQRQRAPAGRRPAGRNCATDVPDVRLEVSGKRGISAFRFRRHPAGRDVHPLRGQAEFDEVEVLANRYLDEFAPGELDRLDVAYTKFESLSRQQAVVETLLPLGAARRGRSRGGASPSRGTQYEFLPSAESILTRSCRPVSR